jgi:hypothetical protein
MPIGSTKQMRLRHFAVRGNDPTLSAYTVFSGQP